MRTLIVACLVAMVLASKKDKCAKEAKKAKDKCKKIKKSSDKKKCEKKVKEAAKKCAKKKKSKSHSKHKSKHTTIRISSSGSSYRKRREKECKAGYEVDKKRCKAEFGKDASKVTCAAKFGRRLQTKKPKSSEKLMKACMDAEDNKQDACEEEAKYRRERCISSAYSLMAGAAAIVSAALLF